MTGLPQSLYRAEQVRELDRRAIEEHGIPGFELMRRAGAAAYHFLRARWPRARRIVCVCGSGNNGGDGYVLATLALQHGLDVTIVAAADARPDTAVQAAAAYRAAGGTVHGFNEDLVRGGDVVVDALLGTGLERTVSDTYALIIGAVNGAAVPVLSLDIPSGLHSDTGQVMGTAVKADATITFIGAKIGLFTGRGREFAGQIAWNDLAVPLDVFSGIEPAARRIEPGSASGWPLQRARDSHKGSSGCVLIVGGGRGMPGAVTLAGQAAYRAGAGLVRVVTHPDHATQIVMSCPELICIGAEDVSTLRNWMAVSDVVAVGPGLGQDAWSRALFSAVLEWHGPLVVDADALNLLASDPSRRNNWILTPHPGEAARLLNTEPAEVQHDRITAAQALRQAYGGIVVLKGSGTLVVDDGTGLCDRGNPGMAAGGMGDVLTGVIAALVAQGMALDDAARTGVWVHAAAGDDAAAAGEIGLMASDLLPAIRRRCNQTE